MLKVFLVEDEVVVRNGIKNIIPWEKEGFEFVGEASDGELAYPFIKKEKPDILITDIKMPFMDGLELSRIVKKEFPQIKILILSGYNDFEYAKTAISIGVTDYLLKPINSVKLLEAVKKVADIIASEREQAEMLERYHTEMEENIHLEQQKLWKTLIEDQFSSAELLEKGHRLDMELTAPVYQVLLFKVLLEDDSVDYSQDICEVSDKIQELCAARENILSFDRSGDGWAFLFKAQSDEEAKSSIDEYCSVLTSLVTNYPEVRFFGGIGTAVHRLRDIRNSYRDASKAFAGRFFYPESRIMSVDELANQHRGEGGRIDTQMMGSKQAERALLDKFLRNGTEDEAGSFLDEYFLGIGEQNCQSLLYRQYVTMDIYFLTADFLKSMEISMEELPEKYRDINELIAGTQSAADMKTVIEGLFKEALRLRDSHSRRKYSAVLEEARSYIRENYQKDDMSLNTVASRVNISPSYFSAIFSAESGQTFVEYLTQVRLEKAKELLMCSNMRTAEIGYEVGYKDSHYFSYIFKKVVGCSPKEYKNRRKEQE